MKKNYVFACLDLIEFYKKAYAQGLDTEQFIESCKCLSSTDLFRFRVFLDSCMLTLNKERVDNEYAKRCDFEGYFEHINNDSDIHGCTNPVRLRDYSEKFYEIETVRKMISIPADKKVRLYYSSRPEQISIDDQINVLRKAFAHSQYSTFLENEDNGYIVGYAVDNAADKDDQSNIESGMVISDVVHSFVLSFYSDYANIGIPYRSIFVSNYSISEKKHVDYPVFYEIKMSDSSDAKYDGFNNDYPMKKLSLMIHQGDDFFHYLSDNESEFNIIEKPLNDVIPLKEIDNICSNYYAPGEESIPFTTVIPDVVTAITNPEVMLSNILTSVSYLNDAVSYYACGACTKEQLLLAVGEIQNEDISLIISQRIGFAIMNSWLIAYMKDFDKDFQTARDKTIVYRSKTGAALTKLLDYSAIDVSCFDCNPVDLSNFSTSNARIPDVNKEFVIRTFRHALMHGNLKVEVKDNRLVVVFYDIVKRTQATKIISVPIEDLETFIEQVFSDIRNKVDYREYSQLDI